MLLSMLRRSGTAFLSLLATALLAPAACTGVKAPDPVSVADAAAPDAAIDDEADPTTPIEKPFAKDSKQALEMMEAAIDARRKRVGRCVEAYRTRKNDPMARLVVKIGVDQEGTLIAVTGKDSETDAAAIECVTKAIRRAPFPRSHTGVIEIVKTFEYQKL